jgi:glycosyltransferase involved in cell wall biosynthesis
MSKLSTIVITYNEESNIKDCLDSLSFSDEIIIIDSSSTDRTREIASAYTDKILITDSESYAQKRNIGIEKSESEWILWIDADERVPTELKNEIQSIVSGTSSATGAYYINRKSYFINKFIKHCGWYPDYTLRLFKKDTGIRFNDSLVHESLIYVGEKKKLKNDILHYTDLAFEHYLEKLNTYTTLSARDMLTNNKKAGVPDILFRPVFTFFKMYFLKLGIADGYMGLILCILSAFHVFMKYSKLYFTVWEKK